VIPSKNACKHIASLGKNKPLKMISIKSKTTRYAAYLRCSSDDQGEGDFTTIDTQRDINTRYILDAGGTLIGVYSDEGKTGTNLNRGGWKQLLADAVAKKFDVVVVTYMSRLGRGNAFIIAEYELEKCGVKVEMVKEKFTDDLSGYVTRSMTNMMDGMYSQMVKGWTQTKIAEMFEKGYYCGGTRPYGYEAINAPGMTETTTRNGKIKSPPKILVPHPEESVHVRAVFQIFADTQNMGNCLRYLQENEPVIKWKRTQVSTMLKNDRMIGTNRHGGRVAHAVFEALIPTSLWDIVQDLLNAPERQEYINARSGWRTNKKKHTEAYYLRGRVRCQHCDCLMTPCSHKGATTTVMYYQCIAGTRQRGTCPITSVNADAVHNAILTEIIRCVEHPSRIERHYREALKAMPQGDSLTDALRKRRRNLSGTQKNLNNITQAIKKAGPLDGLLSEMQRLESLKAEQEAEIQDLEEKKSAQKRTWPDFASLARVWSEFSERWEVLTQDEKNQILNLIVDKVIFTGKTDEGKRVGTMRLLWHQPIEISHQGILEKGDKDDFYKNNISTVKSYMVSCKKPSSELPQVDSNH
jgi:site-specific DNA recombinase